MTHPTRAVARLRSPGEIAATVPALLGFVPTESLVVLSLRPPRARVGLVARVDLPPAGRAGPVVASLVRALRADGAARVLALVHTALPDPAPAQPAAADGQGLPHRWLVEELASALRRAGLGLDDALLVREGRWWSYRCTDPGCCPPEGTPLPDGGEGPGLVAAQAAASGRAVLPDRAALVASVAAPDGEDGREVARALAVEGRDLSRERAARGAREAGLRLRAAACAALQAVEEDPAAELPAQVVARVALALQEVRVRDALLSRLHDRDEGLLGLLLQVARRTPPPHDAGACAALAATAYVRGDGALAHVALDRVRHSDPDHGLGGLLACALEASVPPAADRRALAGPPRGSGSRAAAP